MLRRLAEKKLQEMAEKFPVLVVTGPRQSGKTTMAKLTFPTYRYVSLENPDNRFYAENDPKGFLTEYNQFVIIDEAQNVPQLFSYIQEIVDESGIQGQFILSGSQNFLLFEKITQSLAGRVYMMELLPFCQQEIRSKHEQSPEEAILFGGYPRLIHQGIDPSDFFPSYIQTYIERDVRSILHVQDLNSFQKFLSLCSHSVGQLFNANHFAKIIGVDVKTIKRWLTVLETSYLVFTVKPWHRNFSKRIVKTPKLYFYDTGLASYLLGITSSQELQTSTYKGALFENYMLLEIGKNLRAKGAIRPFHFWRDSNGNEIDLVIEKGNKIQLVEMKYSQTIKPEFIKGLHYLDELNKELIFSHYLASTVDKTSKRTNETILSWKDAALFE